MVQPHRRKLAAPKGPEARASGQKPPPPPPPHAQFQHGPQQLEESQRGCGLLPASNHPHLLKTAAWLSRQLIKASLLPQCHSHPRLHPTVLEGANHMGLLSEPPPNSLLQPSPAPQCSSALEHQYPALPVFFPVPLSTWGCGRI